MTKRQLFVVVVVVVVLIVVAINRGRSHRAANWHGLSESEVRSKLQDKLPSRLPDAKRAHISDTIVTRMRDRGFLSDDIEASTAAAAKEVIDDDVVDVAGDGDSEVLDLTDDAVSAAESVASENA